MFQLILIYTKARDYSYTMDSIKKNYTKEYNLTVVAPRDATIDDKNAQIVNYENLTLLSAPLNKAILSSESDIAIVIKSGTYVTPNSINSLAEVLSEDNISMSMPKINSIYIDQKHEFKNILENQILNEALEMKISSDREKIYTKDVDDNMVAFKKSNFIKLTMFDETLKDLPIVYKDFLLRGFTKGLSAVVCKDTLVYSRNLCDIKCFELDAGSEFTSKLGIHPGSFSGVREDLLVFIQENPFDTFKVLDVGCRAGYTLLSIKNRYKNAELYGIEKVKECTKLSSPFVNMAVGDCMDIINNYDDGTFDYIICNDLLEKLVDPWKFINSCNKKISPNGKLILSIGNIAHIGVIYEILNGAFNYKPYGIQNINNLRFFTLNSVMNLLTQNGFTITQVSTSRSGGPYEDELINELLNTKMIKKEIPQILDLASQFKVLQYNLLCKKVE